MRSFCIYVLKCPYKSVLQENTDLVRILFWFIDKFEVGPTYVTKLCKITKNPFDPFFVFCAVWLNGINLTDCFCCFYITRGSHIVSYFFLFTIIAKFKP